MEWETPSRKLGLRSRSDLVSLVPLPVSGDGEGEMWSVEWEVDGVGDSEVWTGSTLVIGHESSSSLE